MLLPFAANNYFDHFYIFQIRQAVCWQKASPQQITDSGLPSKKRSDA
jgi:hypothetical protein